MSMVILLYANDAFGHGLRIKGNSHLIHERTAVTLFQHQSSLQHRKLSHRLILNFDFRLDQPQGYGNILRVKLDEPKKTLNIFCRNMDNGLLEFKLTEEGLDQLAAIHLDPKNFGIDQWIHLILEFDLDRQQISWHILDKRQVIPFAYTNLTCNNVYFGKNDFSIDIADCSIRGLTVTMDKEHLNFPLRESTGNAIHDQYGNLVGHVENPIWLINESYYWKNIQSVAMPVIGGYQFDEHGGRLLLFDRYKLQILDLLSNTLTERKFPSPLPLDIQLGNSFLAEDRLYIYEVNNLPVDSPTVIALHLETLEVEVLSTDFLTMQLHHHTGQPTRGIPYLLFGGFGNDRYSNTFLALDMQKGVWDTLATSGERIMARYFTSSFYDQGTDHLYVFGGMGNEAGDNTIGRNYRYDLYRLNVNTYRLSKVWEDHWPGKTLVPVRNLIHDGTGSFFALLYPEYLSNSSLQLYRFSIHDGAHEQLGDTIPIRSDKIKTNANLFFYKPLNTFYAITQVFDAEETSSQIAVYELKAPPVSHAELIHYDKQSAIRIPWYIWLLPLGAIIVLGYIRYRRISPSPSAVSATSVLNTYTFPTRNVIHLFGKFEVLDKKGTSIAHLFSGRLKQVLLLFLSRYPGEGIESSEFSTLLWPEKELAAAKNIRGVTLNQFRKLLAYLDGISLVYHDNHYQLQLSGCFVDYLAFKQADKNGEAENPMVQAILARGKFLKNTEHELLDDMKAEIDHKVVGILQQQLAYKFGNGDYKSAIRLARLCLETSPIDLDAFRYEISSMLYLKQRTEAFRRFDHFQQFYQQLMGEPLPFKFKDLDKH